VASVDDDGLVVSPVQHLVRLRLLAFQRLSQPHQ
jgi:hypothetical protein